ncbi:MAG: hypothetical protein ETSY2_13615 [Candidatus Entotheonella gemina]|uniref:Uncharacterized protein n=1 Tax=Candidatus Entotheonella gemina TaxID=1429439 RepID=W4MA15_9BACT|nr:MAG: hypothetical protein ETSY2_13615 [Candidatus Entotheonella gemina]
MAPVQTAYVISLDLDPIITTLLHIFKEAAEDWPAANFWYELLTAFLDAVEYSYISINMTLLDDIQYTFHHV